MARQTLWSVKVQVGDTIVQCLVNETVLSSTSPQGFKLGAQHVDGSEANTVNNHQIKAEHVGNTMWEDK